MGYVDAFSGIEDLGDDEPWCDLVFDLVDTRVAGRKWFVGRDRRTLGGNALATTPRGTIGFSFRTAPVDSWNVATHEDVLLSWGKVRLKSLGSASDLLLGEYASWFKLEDMKRRFVSELDCRAVALGHNANEFFDRPVHMKLFFDPGLPTDAAESEAANAAYAELFLNVDVRNRRVEMKEKDPEYRVHLLGWLSGEHVSQVGGA